MSFSFFHLLAITAAYLFLMFAIAWITDRGLIPARWVRHPSIYVLSLGVYCSSWAIFGSIGYAHEFGYNYVAYFLGISGAFLLAPILLAPILRLTITYQLGSLADLFSFRFRSRFAGSLTTLLMLFSMLPLMALQIKAVAESVELLSETRSPIDMASVYCVFIALLAISLGARHATGRDKHEGLVMAIAAESLVKLMMFGGIAIFALFDVFQGFESLTRWLDDNPVMLARLYFPLQDGSWHSLLAAFFASAVVMPHMFYMAFAENLNPRALVTSSWAFPLFLLAMAIAVPIILWAALNTQVSTPADYFLIGIGKHLGSTGTVMALLAGLTAASGMLIVTTLALSSMALNHLVLPLYRPQPNENLYRRLLWSRRLLILFCLFLAYQFYSWTGYRQSLTELGVLSFVAALQFVPGIISTLFWPAGNRAGLLLGMIAGFSIWLTTLVIPTILPGWEFTLLLDWLDIRFSEPDSIWQTMALISLATNSVIFITASIMTPTNAAEKNAAETCAVDSLRRPYRWALEANDVEDFIASLGTPLGAVTAQREVNLALQDLHLSHSETRPYALRRLRDQLETNLSGLLGPAVAHQLVDDHLPYKPHGEDDSSEDIQFIESRLELYRNRLSGLAAELDSLRRFHRQTLLELPMGVISLGQDGEIIGWNLAMETLTGISGRRMVGSRLSNLPSPWRELLVAFVSGSESHQPQQQLAVQNHLRWFSLHKSAIHNDLKQDTDAGQVIVVEDITDVRSMETQLAHNERLASIGRLAAGVAHEIGNPVTAIACLTQNMDPRDSEEEQQLNLKQILEQTRRITRIVESLVSFSHSGSTASHNKLPTSIASIVEESVALVQLDPAHRQQRFAVQCQPEHIVLADPQRLIQVLINLLNNASDACADDKPILVFSAAHENQIDIIVEDQGEGISEDVKDSLFEPFVTSKPAGRGTGLGLALVYSIIKEHQGNIRVESPTSDKGGTRFIIELPASTAGDPEQLTQEGSST